ncbi:hypothetical protein KP509_33G021000 [Ceratopteris richardii]|uniref:Uncharacterized protein n=1 Tax=Ceratopteris richardii TaxID=49495 RepID=A0A8T2QP17_CERRI|nr:hypothetical protein KP509_33G021000 [Ceratopteris richardii]
MSLIKMKSESFQRLHCQQSIRLQADLKLYNKKQLLGFPAQHSYPMLCAKSLRIKSTEPFISSRAARILSVRGILSPPSVTPSPSNSNDHHQQASLGQSSSLSTSLSSPSHARMNWVEEFIEKAIFNCRFLTILGTVGSLAGSLLCFFKGCSFVVESFKEYFVTCLVQGSGTGRVILLLVEALGGSCFASGARTTVCGSNLFGLFRLTERPKWLEIRSLDELKTKVGHVIVMILLVGMFEKSKKVPVHSGIELLCFSASILFSSGCLYVLSKLHSTH